MTTNAEQLYPLLPAVVRARDAEQGWPLRALLAVMDDEFRLLQVLGEVRRTGVATTPDDGRRWFSAPVFNAEGELRSTISMLVPDGRAVIAAHAPLVARTAREISAGLGARRLLHHA